MKTVDIKGKEYVMVNERIKHFRANFPLHSLTTEIIHLDDDYCVLKASVRDPRGTVLAEGLAREVNGDNYINKTSYVENCETSAWGRALGNFGIGIDASVASAEEVVNAVNNQGKKEQPKQGGFKKNTNTPPETPRDDKSGTITPAQKARLDYEKIRLKADPTDEQKEILTGIHDSVKKIIPSKYSCCVKVFEMMNERWPDIEEAGKIIELIQQAESE